jgi:flagellum-specific ATP synthase
MSTENGSSGHLAPPPNPLPRLTPGEGERDSAGGFAAIPLSIKDGEGAGGEGTDLPAISLAPWRDALGDLDLFRPAGLVTRAVGLAVEAVGLAASIGDLCQIVQEDGTTLSVEVVGFRDDALLLMPLGELHGVRPGSHVIHARQPARVPAGPGLLGRVLDALGNPIDGRGPLRDVAWRLPHTAPPAALDRPRIGTIITTGVRALDGLLTCGRGQRMGIFSGSGVGKSTLLGMIARGASADMNVIALVGERGREVQDFIEKNLGEAGLRRSVVVVATSDQPALVRLKAAWMATAIAEAMRDDAGDVLMLLDSLTRVAMAQREIGLAIGEPPALRGYTPSVFALLPRLLERTGMAPRGTITAFYTILVEGDDMNEPVADTVRGVLDGHLVLARALATENLYPAIDILHSISRVMDDLVTPSHREAAAKLREHLATYERHRDLVTIGAYVAGSSLAIDAALAMLPKIREFRRQDQYHLESFDRTVTLLEEITR